MALENITNAIIPELNILSEKLIIILQIIGIVILVYIIFLIIKGILGWRRNKRIDITYEKVLEIDRKLDELLKRTARKEKIQEKPEKKKGFFARLFKRKSKEKKK